MLQTMWTEHLLQLQNEKQEPSGCQFSFILSDSVPFFSGHFPGNPILPAICFFEISHFLLSKLNFVGIQSRYEVQRSKFVRPLIPNAPVKIDIKKQGEGLFKIQWSSHGKKISSLKMLFNEH